eukprot:jgi/Chlat1/9033/Chrsp94S08353
MAAAAPGRSTAMLLAALLAACLLAQAAAQFDVNSCVQTYDGSNIYLSPNRLVSDGSDGTQSVVTVARDFSVQYFANYKRCGTPAPATTLYPNAKYLAVPIQAIATTETISITFLEVLGLRDRLKFIGSSSYVSSPCVQSLYASGQIRELSPVTSNGTFQNGSYIGWLNQTEHEAQMAQVGMLILDSYTSSFLLENYTSNVPDTNPKNVDFDTTTDKGMLQRAEWVKFLSLFFNKEYEATQYFNAVAARYACYSAQAKATNSVPAVAFIGGCFVNPTNPYCISYAAYKVDLITSAGGRSIQAPAEFDTTVQYNTRAEFEAAVADVDFVVDESYDFTPTNHTFSDFLAVYGFPVDSPLKFIRNKGVLRFDGLVSPGGGLDWFEGAIATPDAVLGNFITFLHPTSSLAANAPRNLWFRNATQPASTSDIVTASNCTSINGPLQTPVFSCQLTTPALAPTLAPTIAPAPAPASSTPPPNSAVLSVRLTGLFAVLVAVLVAAFHAL